MKKFMLMAAILMGAIIAKAQVPPPPPPPPPPANPTIKIEEDKVTIVTPEGNVYIIYDESITKNGVVLDPESTDLREEMEDIQDELANIRAENITLKMDSEEYAELLEDLQELEGELGFLGSTMTQIDTLPGDSTSITIGNWRLIVHEEGEDDEDVDVSFGKVPEV
ncbi:MAG: hypothetical protein WAT43_18945, partial [Chitinophagales bacterium]